MQCSYFDARACRSCTLMGVPHADQLAGKERACRDLLAGHHALQWLPAVAGQEDGYRNKAKMVVGGTVEQPTLGILDADGHGVDLRACGICSPGLRAALPVLAALVTRARLTPYDVPTRTGELKHLLVTESPDGALMVRFVLRSQEPVSRLRKHLPWLLGELPSVVVATANLQPAHAAVLEGDRELLLTGASTLRMRLPGLPEVHLPPKSFFQTNTGVAASLYRQATDWVDDLSPASVWDLYCGVGGFALALAAPGRAVLGVEASTDAVAGARRSAADAGLDVQFEVGDATAFVLAADATPDLVVVNPPRRGLGAELPAWLEASGVEHVVYSSCNAASLAQDLRRMPSLRPRLGRVLDMFPQTPHYEVLLLLSRGPTGEPV